jgi:hypothetical protein
MTEQDRMKAVEAILAFAKDRYPDLKWLIIATEDDRAGNGALSGSVSIGGAILNAEAALTALRGAAK